ncbi:HNH endonuclease signature motif containing protein [Methylobacterium sp. CM6247]
MSGSRTEFSKAVRRAAWARAGGECERILEGGIRCGCPLTPGKHAYDHVIPDQMGGEPTLENCQCLCSPCHTEKTRQDVADIAKAKRRQDNHLGIRPPTRLQGRGFQKFAPQRSATRSCPKTEIAYKRDR